MDGVTEDAFRGANLEEGVNLPRGTGIGEANIATSGVGAAALASKAPILTAARELKAPRDEKGRNIPPKGGRARGAAAIKLRSGSRETDAASGTAATATDGVSAAALVPEDFKAQGNKKARRSLTFLTF